MPMGVRSRFAAGVVAGAALALAPGSASARTQDVDAAGDPFTPGTLAFKPSSVRVAVGDFVKWTNTDDVVPHTATEDHGLWDLTGTYGIPGNYGFGPGESRQRKFEAGTQHYYCKVHPTQMRGVVRVPVRASVKKLPDGKRRIAMRWAPAKPAAGQVFDVQLKRGVAGKWRKFRQGTRDPAGGRKTSGDKIKWSIRARLRSASDKSKATGWSPVATVKA
jgi:plastocyanin